MTHDDTRELIDAYADGELDLVTSRELEHHLESCPECRRIAENVHTLRDVFQKTSPAYRASTRLRRNVRTALRREKKSHAASFFRTLALAAACVIILWSGWQFLQTRSRQDVADEVVASHVRSLLATHLVDVASTDQHTVKPWFDGKIDFAPNVSDFAADGFPLVGGRLDYLNDAPAAALVYRRNNHPINLLIQPATGRPDSETSALIRRGYNLIHWTRAGMNYWAISDLNAVELREFVQRYRRL